jgi:hypothetical protein
LVRTLIAGFKANNIQQGDCVLLHLGNSVSWQFGPAQNDSEMLTRTGLIDPIPCPLLRYHRCWRRVHGLQP